MNLVLPTTGIKCGHKKPRVNGATTPRRGICKNEDIVMNIFDYMQDVGRPIAYYPRMAHFFGSVNASIMFSQLFYWQDRTTNELGVYKTAEEWTEETGLSYREQATARAYLVKQGFLIETHKRIEHRIYYKLNRDAICHAFDLWRQGQKTTSDESAIPERRKRNSGTTIPQSGECAIRNSGTTIPQPVYKTETTSETTHSNTPKPPATPGAEREVVSAAFAAFWKTYPKKVGKDAAAKVWARKVKADDVQAVMDALDKQRSSEQWTQDGGRFIPHPSTWLNQGRWKDEDVADDEPRSKLFAGVL